MSEHNEFPQGQPYGQQPGGATPAQGGQAPQYQQPYPPQYQQPQPEPKKKRGRGCLWMILGALLLIVLIIVGIMALFGSAANKVDKDLNAKHTVTYKVTGVGPKADMTYSTDTGTSNSQDNGATLPWTKTVNVKGVTTGMNVIASNPVDGGSGKITCVIDVDGKQVTTATASGQAANADCTAP